VPRDVHHVVHPAEEPEVAVLVDAGAVAGEVHAGEALPVRGAEAAVVAEDPARHRRPGTLQDEVAPTPWPDGIPAVVDDASVDPGEGPRRGAGLRRRHAREWRDEDHPRLGLPPGVDDRRAIAADVLPVPHPGLRVDRLTD
jgi:hypothetical protein